MIRILFVCHGNICRSAAAKYIMQRLVEEAHLSARFLIDSAATSTEELGNPVYPPMKRVLESHSIPCGGHRARQIRRSDYDHYDFLIGTDHANIRNMERMYGGDPEGKITQLLDYAGRIGQEVADPWYTGDFDATWDDVQEGCMALLQDIRKKHRL